MDLQRCRQILILKAKGDVGAENMGRLIEMKNNKINWKKIIIVIIIHVLPWPSYTAK